MSELDEEERKRRREVLNELIEAYLKITGALGSGELPINWVILVPTVGVDRENDETSYVYRIMRNGSMPAWMLMGILEHEMTTNRALVTSREWAVDESDESD